MRKQPNVVWLRLLYDAFAPETVETHELKWRRNATVGDYLQGLPPECEWMVFVNGTEVELDAARDQVLDRGDQIGLILVPQGGGGGFKSVLRIVMQAAAVALAFTGIGFVAALAINIGIGLVNAFLLTPKPPKTNSGDSSQSYGIDGAKNSATEGIPYPVGYGEFRVAGNFSDCYTQNVGDVQYLYIRQVLNDGEVDSLSEIEINEQPIANFTDVEYRFAKGTLDQGLNDWFTNSVVQVNKSQKIDTGWLEHITTSEVDKIRWDLVFSNGLVDIDSKKGTYKNRTVAFHMEVQPCAPDGTPIAPYRPVQSSYPSTISADLDGDGKISVTEAMFAVVMGRANAGSISKQSAQRSLVSTAPDILYRPVGAGDDAWTSVGGFTAMESSFVFDPSGDGSIAGETDITPQVSQAFQIPMNGSYEVKPVNGATIEHVQVYPTSTSFSQSFTDNRTRAIRHTIETTQLEKGYYRARIRRTTATSTDQYKIDEVYLADVAEIECDQVPQAGTASLSLRIKLTEQLNSIPTVTTKLKGSVVQFYDEDGNPTSRGWTDNCAWIGLDILCGEQRGAGFKLKRIDWPRWHEYVEHCAVNKIGFNGVFDTATNVGDALQQVLRIGHAAPIPFGTKLSVAIDRPRAPVAYFGPGNIIKDSFEVSYMGMSDRANEFEVSYFDRTDRNKQKAIRYVDPKAVAFNEVQRLASVTFQGIDNIEQAKAELWRMIYANRLLMRTVTFDAFLDAINLALGDVALIQHDQMQWANGGRLSTANSPTELKTSSAVVYDPERSYAALVHFPALSRGKRTINSVVGRKLLVTGASVVDANPQRIMLGGVDYEVVKVQDGNPYHTITLRDVPKTLTGDVELWSTDVLEERRVAAVVQRADGTAAIALAQPLSANPDDFANFVFGEVKNVKKPFALTGVSGTGIEKRKLTFMEYHEGVYGPPEVEIPVPVQAVTDRDVAQVSNLLFDFERLAQADRKTINARVHWAAAGIRNYGGADVYMSVNGGAWTTAASAQNVTEITLAVNAGDSVAFKVVAYNKRGDRAPIGRAPVVVGTVDVTFATLDPPTNLNVIATNFTAVGAANVNFTAPADLTGVTGFEGRYKRKTDSAWISLGEHRETAFGLNGLQTGVYQVEVRSVSESSISAWLSKEFSIAVTPAGAMDFSSWNNRNADPIPAPVTNQDVDVDHTLNTDGSADISFEWEWAGDEGTIDGFVVEYEVAAT